MAGRPETIHGELLELECLQEAAECLRSIAHPLRLRMLQMLLRGQFRVGQLAEACEIPSHMASEHLRLMQRCGLLRSRREGRCTYYEIAQPHLTGIMACIEDRFRRDGETSASSRTRTDRLNSNGGRIPVSRNHDSIRSGKANLDLLLVAGLLLGWFAFQAWVLPSMGVST